VRIWDTATGHTRTTLTGHTGPVTAVAFSPDGTHLATTSHDQTARIWDTATGAPRAALRVDAPLTGCAWHPHEPVIALAGNAGVYLLTYRS
jgi:WD40 repeat protein